MLNVRSNNREGNFMKKGTTVLAMAILLLTAGSCTVSATCMCMVLGIDFLPVHGLPLTKDAIFSQNLQDILNGYRYTENYSAGRFDCMDTTIIATRVLQEYGYNPSTMARFVPKGWDGNSHMWLAVSDGKGRFAFIETGANATGQPVLGELVTAEQSTNYASGYVLFNPMRVVQCFGYSEDRFLSNLGKVEKTAIGPIVLRQAQEEKNRWLVKMEKK
jgi:hypothetical protein